MATEANGVPPGAGNEGRSRPGRGAVPPAADRAAGEPEPSYRELSQELDDIVERLEGPDVDIDEVSALFARAVELAQTLHDRLTRTETSVEELSTRLAGLPGPDGRTARGGSSAPWAHGDRGSLRQGGARGPEGPGAGAGASGAGSEAPPVSSWDDEDEPF